MRSGCAIRLRMHFPKLASCETGSLAKIQRSPCRNKKKHDADAKDRVRSEKFGDLITAYHAVMREKKVSGQGERATLIVQDIAPHWLDS